MQDIPSQEMRVDFFFDESGLWRHLVSKLFCGRRVVSLAGESDIPIS